MAQPRKPRGGTGRKSAAKSDAKPAARAAAKAAATPAARPRARALAADVPATIDVWMDDPAGGKLVARPRPDPGLAPLKFSFEGPAPEPIQHLQGTAEFRYWVTAEALRRGADFWLQCVPEMTAWQNRRPLAIVLSTVPKLNAFYDRETLTFHHGPGPGTTVHADESADIVCHELGHAVLDVIKPQLWDLMDGEVASFHEAFGDISAMLCALQVPEMREAVLRETNGDLNRSSRLSRIAEELGSAMHHLHPDRGHPDCLRNTANAFFYQNPINLPSTAPSTMLSSAPHNFSRVFSAAFLDGLAAFLKLEAGIGNPPGSEHLRAASVALAKVLIAGVRKTPVVSNFFAQVAGGMITHAASVLDRDHANALKTVFVRRGILSIAAAVGVTSMQDAASQLGLDVENEPTTRLAMRGGDFGLGEAPLVIQSANQVRQLAVASAAIDFGQAPVPSSEVSARSFIEDLMRNGRLDAGDVNIVELSFLSLIGLKTHALANEGGVLTIKRRFFDCGLCPI